MPDEKSQPQSPDGRAETADIEVELQPDMQLGSATADLDEADMQERIQKQLRYAQMKEQMKEKMEKGQKPEPSSGEEGKKSEEPPVEVPPEVCKVIFDTGSYTISCPKFRLSDNEAETMANSLTALLEGFPIGGSKIWHLIIVLMITLGKVAACREAIMRIVPKKKEEKPEEPVVEYQPVPERTPNPRKITYADNIAKAVNRAAYDTAMMKAQIPKE